MNPFDDHELMLWAMNAGLARDEVRGYVRREGTRLVGQKTLLAQTRHVFDELPGTQVIAAGLVGTVGVIQDHHVKS